MYTYKGENMTKKQNLASALNKASVKPVTSIPKDNTKVLTPNVAPSRKGKKAITGFFDPAVSKQLKQIALNNDQTIQSLLAEALNDLFMKNNKSPIA